MGQEHVLVVDDDDDIRAVTVASLARLGGLRVTAAPSGAAAIEQARAVPPDAILLDVMMPGMDGPTTLAALRADAALAGVPVVFLTAKAMPAELAALLATGAAGVLAKPFDPVLLPAQVRAVLGWTAP